MRAIISVSDKTGVVEFAKALSELGVEIISTGGTASKLADEGVNVIGISDITGFPECLDGRVKTLHPAVHGGILAMREKPEHMKQIADLGIEPIDIVAINLYPFKQTILKEGVTREEAIENIDIGGPTMLRSAAKNHKDVAVIVDPADYVTVVEELKSTGSVSYDTKYRLALKVFEHTAAYDALISDYLRKEIGAPLPDNLTLTFEKIQDLRYGENSHQSATYYKGVKAYDGAIVNAKQLQGKELSFNNINDANGALMCLKEFEEPACVAVKHANPCAVALGKDIYEAYIKAYNADPVSIFGGIVALNREVDKATAEELAKIFLEIVIAPGYTDEALEVLSAKKNLRVMVLDDIMKMPPDYAVDIKKVTGGILVQDMDLEVYNDEDVKVVTKRQPTAQELEDMKFGMKVVKHIRSNGIVLVKEGRTVGIGPGQVNRIWAAQNSIRQGGKDVAGCVLASDAFFPFNDTVQAAAEAGIRAIVQPGGSVRDQESIDLADDMDMAMIFTGMRHFKH